MRSGLKAVRPRFPGDRLRTELEARGYTIRSAARLMSAYSELALTRERTFTDWILGAAQPRPGGLLEKLLEATGIPPDLYRPWIERRNRQRARCPYCKQRRVVSASSAERGCWKRDRDGVFVGPCR